MITLPLDIEVWADREAELEQLFAEHHEIESVTDDAQPEPAGKLYVQQNGGERVLVLPRAFDTFLALNALATRAFFLFPWRLLCPAALRYWQPKPAPPPAPCAPGKVRSLRVLPTELSTCGKSSGIPTSASTPVGGATAEVNSPRTSAWFALGASSCVVARTPTSTRTSSLRVWERLDARSERTAMTDRTHQFDRIHDALQDRNYRPVATYQQAATAPGKDGRVEYWAGSKGDRLVQVRLEHGVVTSVEVYTPLVESSSLAKTLEAL
jgi:hypothetical protein